MGNAPLRIQLLGGFAVSRAGRPVPPQAWRLRKAKSLIKLLALAQRAPRRAQRGGRAAVARALARGGREQLRPGAACGAARRSETCGADGDVVDEHVGRRARAARARGGRPRRVRGGSRESRRAPDRRERSARRSPLHTGELLPEDLYEDWTAARREAVHEQHLRLLDGPRGAARDAGDSAEAIEALERVVVADPLHEGAHRALMRLFAAGGRRQRALEQYQRLRHVLRRELEADPDPATRSLYRELLAAGREPPRRSPTGNLPQARTSFVGRERALTELDRLLRARAS